MVVPPKKAISYLDFEQSLFSLKTVGKMQNKHQSVTETVTALPLVVRASEDVSQRPRY